MFYTWRMSKRITPSQLLGELGEAAARKRFLSMRFQFDPRSRLEAGIDAIVEVMLAGKPLARMIAVQVKTTEAGDYTGETDTGFSYLLNSDDLAYWRGSNLPVIVVLYRVSDESFYWKSVGTGVGDGARRLTFSKTDDVLDHRAADRLAALTVPKQGPGYYVPPLGGGEDALVNVLPIKLPDEIFVASTPYAGKRATAVLLQASDHPRFDWIISGDRVWSFHDPRLESTRAIVDIDQVEALETAEIAFHEDMSEQNNFAHLLRKIVQHQFRTDLRWEKTKKLFYFSAFERNTPREFAYEASKRRASAAVVNVTMQSADPERVSFVRHHAFIPRFECLLDEWHLIVTPTYHFTTNGFVPHSYPDALLAGKKRLDNNASLRGQLVMWHRLLSQAETPAHGLFEEQRAETPILGFGAPPVLTLPTSVPEDAWGSPPKAPESPPDTTQPGLL
jgi:hypothetical protein